VKDLNILIFTIVPINLEGEADLNFKKYYGYKIYDGNRVEINDGFDNLEELKEILEPKNLLETICNLNPDFFELACEQGVFLNDKYYSVNDLIPAKEENTLT
jgi:hypothetical protein